MASFPYQFFDEYVFRTPLFSRKKFQEKLDSPEISNEELKIICSDSVFQEAIYLASPYVYNELKRWLNSEKEFLSKEFQKFKATILKYYSRTSTRCTPFGLFSEVGLGRFSGELKINYKSNPKKIRDTKLDMHFLVGLIHHLVQTPKVRNQLLFFPNNSIYKVGNKIRYVEYEYTKEKRDYIISSAPLSEELQQILNFSSRGKTIDQISETLIDKEITKEEAVEFINELIDNQVLVSELEPIVSGSDFLEVIISVLNNIEAKKENEILVSIQRKLKKLDQNIGNPTSSYTEIEKLIQAFNTEYKANHLFQTDLYYEETFTLPSFWKKEIKQAIRFLNKLFLLQKETHLEKFKKAFYERFETQEVSLSYVLDTEVGIGYRQDGATKGIHPYLENLELPLSQKSNIKIKLDPIQQILNEKVQEALLYNQFVIKLLDEDFKGFEENWNDLPNTISFMAEIISEGIQEKLFLNGGGGSSAANLLGRFCSEKSKIQQLAKNIAQKEDELDQNYILAEIIHLPEARTGNIIRRPALRQYEIPYLAQSVLPKESQILVDDLYISLKSDRIVLRSKKLNREIKPYLTNAHDYSANPLPVYHFLCDLYSQNIRSGIYFNWGDLRNIYHFLPRVEYRNIILSKAWWKVTEKEITHFAKHKTEDKEQLLSEIGYWRNKRKIPQWIQWIQSDNKLTINLENYEMVKVFIDTIKILKSITIEEFLYNKNDDFMHQYVFSMYKESKTQAK